MKSDGTKFAKPGTVWVCNMCGRSSRTRYGFDSNNCSCADQGWDAGCMMNSVLCYERKDPNDSWEAVP